MPLAHISASDNRLRIALHNFWCRVYYIWKLKWRGVRHVHHFQRWTGAQNLLCWCGAVKRAVSGPDNEKSHVLMYADGRTAMPWEVDRYYIVTPSKCSEYRTQSMEGEDALRFFDAAGSGWIREVAEGDPLDAEVIG